MAKKSKEPFNPFYTLVLPVGVVFTLTACAYGWMVFLDSRRYDPTVPSVDSNALLGFLDQHGLLLIVVELAVLGAATVGALAWDQYGGGGEAAADSGTSDDSESSSQGDSP